VAPGRKKANEVENTENYWGEGRAKAPHTPTRQFPLFPSFFC